MTTLIKPSPVPTQATVQRLFHQSLAVLLLAAIVYQPYNVRVMIYSRLVDIATRYTTNEYYTHMWLFILNTTILHAAIYMLANGIVSICYYLQHPLIEQYKCNRSTWPWLTNKRQQYYKLIENTLYNVAFTQFIITPCLSYLSFPRTNTRVKFHISDIPDTMTLLYQLLLCCMIEDTLFYFVHRLLHTKKLYWIHKVHHAHTQTVGIASEYSHWIEFIISSAIPFVAGPNILHVHCYTYYIWLLLRIIKTTDAHCGYSFPFSPFSILPFQGTSAMHDAHHMNKAYGNFSSFFMYWDYICGTIIHIKDDISTNYQTSR